MSLPLTSTAPERRLLAEGRTAGPMPWVIAIMTFLTVLAAAAGMALAGAAGALRAQAAGRVTIQIAEADRPTRDAQAEAVERALRSVPGVERIDRLSDARLAGLVEPWIGSNELDLPQPALIDVDLAGDSAFQRLEAVVKRAAPGARVDSHATWLAPLKGLIDALRGLAWTLILLTGAATAASVVLASRAALNTHRETIDVLHLLGATDLQVARLFQRRIAVDAMIGAGLGFVVGLLVLVLLGRQAAALKAGLTEASVLDTARWLALLLVPLGAALLATAIARMTVENALRRSL